MTLTEAEAKSTQLAGLRRWFAAVVRMVQVGRGSFADDPQSNIERLSQAQVHTVLVKVTNVFWAQGPATRALVRSDYWRALITLKLAADDVFIESLEVSRRQADSNTLPTGVKRLLEADVRVRYRKTIEAFIRGHPFLITDPTQRATPLYPLRSRKKERARAGILDIFPLRLFASDRLGGKRTLVDIAADEAGAVERAFGRVTGTNAKDFVVREEAAHVLGAYFVLLQLYLSDLREVGGSPLFPAAYWYQGARDAIEELRTKVLGLHVGLERKALDAGDAALAKEISSAEEVLLNRLLRHYSVRVEESVGAWVFRTRRALKTKGGVFLQSRVLIGANKEKETLLSYLGRGNPDGDAPEGMDVAHLLANTGTFAGKTVKVLGDFRARTRTLRSLSGPAAVLISTDHDNLRVATLAGAAVEVEGELDTSGSSPVLVADRVRWFAQGYLTSVGFPMPQSGTPARLDLTPSWRRVTAALHREAQTERSLYSIPATIVGQQRLLVDLLGVPEVGKALRRAVRRQKAELRAESLHDHVVRMVAWKSLFASLHRENPDTALTRLLEYLQRYLTHYTRHTLWNVRDSGKQYFRTTWPLTIDGRAVFDCGVYTVLMALDLYHAIAGVKGLSMRFGYVTILNHITLVAYTTDESLFLNNDRLLGPVPVPAKARSNAAERADFALRRWGRAVFTDTYRVQYGVALVRVPHETVSSRSSEAAFKKRLWSSYLRHSKWWGLQPGVADAYHANIALFDKGMRAVQNLLDQTERSAPASSDAMVRMSKDAKLLFELADRLAHPDNFGERPEFKGKTKDTSAIGIVHPPGVEPPIYDVVRRLFDAKKAKQALTPEQDALLSRPTKLEDHAKALNRIGSP